MTQTGINTVREIFRSMPMETLGFRQACEADLHFLVELRSQTMSRHEIASGMARSSEQCLSRVLAAFHAAQIITQGGQAVGLLKILRDGSRWELLQLQLVPAVQGQGIGSYVVRSLIAEAKAAGASSLKLNVLKANPARRLYERLGFIVVGEKDYSYEMAREP